MLRLSHCRFFALSLLSGACSAAPTPASPSDGADASSGSSMGAAASSDATAVPSSDSGTAAIDADVAPSSTRADSGSAISIPPDNDASANGDAEAADGPYAPEGGPADAGGASGDTPPARPLMVDTIHPQSYTITFKPSDADPAVSTRNETQTALLDTTKTLQAKLVVTLSGSGNPPGPIQVGTFAASLGFHVFVIAYANGWDPSTQNNPDYFGNSRFNELDGMARTPGFQVVRADSVEERLLKALEYLRTKHPAGDWGYYLDTSGQVRWSDVIFMGQSHGATSAAAYAKKHRVWRAISLSGPRDTNPVVATWLSLPSPTPIDRYYGFTGTMDSQHPDHIKSMEVMGYLGTLTNTSTAAAPYGGSHRLEYNGGHTDDTSCGGFVAQCKYMLGVP